MDGVNDSELMDVLDVLCVDGNGSDEDPAGLNDTFMSSMTDAEKETPAKVLRSPSLRIVCDYIQYISNTYLI
jgi:hypothetical protein